MEIDDRSSTHNFHLRDLTFGGTHLDYKTGTGCQGTFYWTVTFETAGLQNADYEYLSDADPDHLRSLITAHPPVGNPPPPGTVDGADRGPTIGAPGASGTTAVAVSRGRVPVLATS